MASRQQSSKTVAALDVALVLAILAVMLAGIWFGLAVYDVIG